MRLIDADALRKNIIGVYMAAYSCRDEDIADMMEDVLYEIDTAPTVDAEPVRHGNWMGTVCSACGKSTSFYYDCDYCPNCGAKMEEQDD